MGMRVTEAVAQIAEIHGFLVRVEIYRGFRSLPVALSGLCGLFAAVLQDWGWVPDQGRGLVVFWVIVALASGLTGTCEVVYHYAKDNEFGRRKTRRVLGQFVPCLVVGAVTTLLLARENAAISLLPGLWAVFFGLGMFAARPYLPRAIGWVALSYLIAGCVLLDAGLTRGVMTLRFPGWHVGFTFAIGQILAALVLYWNLERRSDHV